MKKYATEREGQLEFFDNFKIDYKNNDVLIDNTDGVWNGNLLEFKLNISDLNKVLFQSIKYLSNMRVKGESIPKNILLISLNTETAYLYHSKDYFDDIHKIYVGSASKNNDGFSAKNYIAKYEYSNQMDALAVIKVLSETEYMPIDLDENCIVGWAERYYAENPSASKGDFLGDDTGKIKILGEIREPKHFKGLINPYTKETNERFKYLMDKLNDRLRKKDLGAFYTPIPYAEKAAELVRMAIERVPEGNDYVIIDRCAGTGNLESVLSDEELSHCILSTYEYYEYKVLAERLGQKVRAIIPPTEANVEYANGCVINADAMSEEYINNPILQSYIQNPKCTIIMYENPPYHDESSGITNGKVERSGKSNTSFVTKEMKNEVKGVATNELANRFIWSAFKYYLRQETDSYIVFSPIKYWKQYNFVNNKAEKAYIFNRTHFHATESSILCVYWSNINSEKTNFLASAYNIVDSVLQYEKDLTIQKVFNTSSKNYSKINFKQEDLCDLHCSKDGIIAVGKKIRVKSYFNDNVIGYLEADSFSIDANVRQITRLCLYNGNGCYLLKNNYHLILPIWVAKHVPLDNWYEKDIYATTADGGDAYTKDTKFLKSCLIYTCLSNQNKCLSFHGSDGRDYQNELCFDERALAKTDLDKMTLDNAEKELLNLWDKILLEAKKTSNYDSKWNYGVYQITKELNTFQEVKSGKSKQRVYDYPELNGDLNTLKTKLKEYYKSHITEKMFKYELLK